MTEVASPCNRICTLDAANVCIGCGRTLDEIGAWGAASPPVKREIAARAAARLAAMPAARLR